MDDNLFSTIISGAVTIIGGAVGWLLKSHFTVKSTAEKLEVKVQNLEKVVDGFDNVPSRMASLETEVRGNFQEIMRTLNRLEAATVRKQKDE